MQKFVLWLALGCLVVAAGVFAFQLSRPDESAWTPLGPAPVIAASTGESAEPARGSVAERTNGAAGGGPDLRVAVLEVTVLAVQGGTTPQPMAGRDVDVAVDVGADDDGDGDGASRQLRQPTDESGVARFSVTGGHGHKAQINTGAAQASAELRADDVVRVTLTVAARIVVKGSVVDQSGHGIGGADLVLLPWLDAEGLPPRTRRVGKSRADGTFSIGLGSGGRLAAGHAGFAPSAMFPIPPAGDPTEPPVVHTVQLTLQRDAASLDVQVLDARERPVPQAEIELRAASAPPPGASLAAPPQRHRADDDGHVTAVDLRPGRIEYVVRARGHATARGRCEAPAGRSSRLVVRLTASCDVHGFVEMPDGTRVAGARVWAGSPDAVDESSVLSDGNGAFHLVDLPAGTQELSAREGATFLSRAGAMRAHTRLDLDPGAAAQWIAVLEAPSAGSMIEGTVVDTGDRLLAGWRIALRAGSRVTSTGTDQRGTFRATRPGPGHFDAFVYAPDQPVGAFAAAVKLDVDPDAGPLRLVVDRNARTTSIVGRVTSLEQEPLAATIACYHHERRETARFQAPKDGTIRIVPVPPGTLDVHVEHPGKAPLVQKRLRAGADRPLDLGQIVLGEAASLHGTVAGPGGVAPEQATIALQTKDQRIQAEYAAGAYRFPAVPPGEHVLQVQGHGVAAVNFVVQLSAGVDREQNIELRAGVPRRVAVRGPRHLTSPIVLAIRVPGKAHAWTSSAALRADPGSESASAEFVAYMAAGTYEAIAWADGWEARAQVAFAAGDDTPVVLELRPN